MFLYNCGEQKKGENVDIKKESKRKREKKKGHQVKDPQQHRGSSFPLAKNIVPQEQERKKKKKKDIRGK